MLLKYFRVTTLNPAVRAHLAETKQPQQWDIAANSLPSAWGKFCKQHFGVLLPNPADYDITLHHTRSV